jgi:hypothetical protein
MLTWLRRRQAAQDTRSTPSRVEAPAANGALARFLAWCTWYAVNPGPTAADRQREEDARAARIAAASQDQIAETIARQRMWTPDDW